MENYFTSAVNYVRPITENFYARIVCAVIYICVIISGVTLYALIPHDPNLVGMFTMTLLFTPPSTYSLWYVITHERYNMFDHTKLIVYIFNTTVFISMPFNHLLLLINSAIAYSHPNVINIDAITYVFITFGWSTIASVLVTMLSIPTYGLCMVAYDKCKKYKNNMKSTQVDIESEHTSTVTNVLSTESINNVMQEV